MVARAKESVLSELDRLELRKNGKPSATKLKRLPIFQQTGRLGQMVKVSGDVRNLFTSELMASVGDLIGSAGRVSGPVPQLLLSFPHSEEWSLKALNWHLDLAVPKVDVIPGVQAFVLIDDLQPRGGATLALAGSHKLPYGREGDRGSSAAVLRTHAVFSRLFDGSTPSPEKFFEPHSVNGVDVFIVEMSGKAGDVFLMDMRVLHSPSVNATRNIRMMVTSRWIRPRGE
jgi:hypothetical protein